MYILREKGCRGILRLQITNRYWHNYKKHRGWDQIALSFFVTGALWLWSEPISSTTKPQQFAPTYTCNHYRVSQFILGSKICAYWGQALQRRSRRSQWTSSWTQTSHVLLQKVPTTSWGIWGKVAKSQRFH